MGAEITKKEEYFKNENDINLYERWWIPEEYHAALIIVHGYAENSVRYDYAATHFAQNGFLCAAYDHQAHGKSDGEKAYVESFQALVEDLAFFKERVAKQINGKPLFMLGHSMGGNMLAHYAVKFTPEDIAGYIFSGAGLKLYPESSGAMLPLFNIIGGLLPKLKLTKIPDGTVCRDPEISRIYNEDPLNYRGRIHIRTLTNMLNSGQYVFENLDKLTTPSLILHGSGDLLVPPSTSQELFDKIPASDKTLKFYEDFYHEIMNEPGKEEVLTDITDWMKKRL